MEKKIECKKITDDTDEGCKMITIAHMTLSVKRANNGGINSQQSHILQ